MVKPSFAEHVMLMYDNDIAREEAAIKYINDGLKQGKFIVYASTNADDEVYMARVRSRINDYENSLERGDLFITGLKTFYMHSVVGGLEPFRELKIMLEEILQERINAGKRDEMIIVGELAGYLSKIGKLDESVFIERWWHATCSEWHDKKLKITVICPHPSSVLDKQSFAQYKLQISRHHSVIVNTLGV
jgi:hypothetical protein